MNGHPIPVALPSVEITGPLWRISDERSSTMSNHPFHRFSGVTYRVFLAGPSCFFKPSLFDSSAGNFSPLLTLEYCDMMNQLWTGAVVNPDKTLLIEGERFYMENHLGKKILTHPRWSLMGTGKTEAEAFAALKNEAEEIADFYLSKPDDSLTVEAIALKAFLKRFLAS